MIPMKKYNNQMNLNKWNKNLVSNLIKIYSKIFVDAIIFDKKFNLAYLK